MGYIGDQLNQIGADAENFGGIRETARNFTSAIESRFKTDLPEPIVEQFLDVLRNLAEHAKSTSAAALLAENEQLKAKLAAAEAAAAKPAEESAPAEPVKG